MRALINACIDNARVVLALLAMLVIGGYAAYQSLPKESSPDVQIPIVYVSMSLEGISPDDSERLLARPMEQHLRAIEGLKEMRSMTYLGGASTILEFQTGFDIDKALVDVRDKVDLARPDLPDSADEPTVHEVNISLFPVIVVTLSGDLPERTLMRLADRLKDKIEGIGNVLEARLQGQREELVELVIDPLRFESYGLVADDLAQLVGRSNRLVAAGTLDTGLGRFAIKVPGLFETAEDILNMPVKVSGDAVTTVRDIATLRQTYKDATSLARIDGLPAVGIEVSKRTGTNLIDTVEEVRRVVAQEQQSWPAHVKVTFSQDTSNEIRHMLSDLENSLILAVILVMIVIVASLGLRGGLIVGSAVPGSFLIGILALAGFGITINIVVLFSLIMATGMLVDGAIILVEYADRRMLEGMDRRQAYAEAARMMAWPIFSSIATIIAAFLPMAFWPGVVGGFMKYLPMTLTATLLASLAMAMIFIPVIGALIGKPNGAALSTIEAEKLSAAEQLARARGLDRLYLGFLRRALKIPGTVIAGGVGILIGTVMLYALVFPTGIEFFPEVEPDNAQLQIHARGNLSVDERDRLVRQVEAIALELQAETAEFRSIYSVTIGGDGGQSLGEEMADDVIGYVNLEFTDWQDRRRADAILADLGERSADLPGIHVETRKQEGGPGGGKPIHLEVASRDYALLAPTAQMLRAKLESMPGLVAIEDSLPVPGIEWKINVDRAQAAKFGADVTAIGNAVQLVTRGLKFGDYRPDWADDEIDIVARFPIETRNVSEIDQLRLPTALGVVPISNFVEREAVQKLGLVRRVDGERVVNVRADVAPGVLADDQIDELRTWLADATLDPAVTVQIRGQDEDQKEAQAFLGAAFAVTLALITLILLLQFNSFFFTFLVLSSIVMSTIGVMVGLMVMGQPFGIVMSGIGVIALAGIIVNNNIVLIDTYKHLLRTSADRTEALLLTGVQRLRPVILTKLTTVLGLIPMIFQVNIDFATRAVTLGAPATQWWTQLATAIAFGVLFASPLTLVFTPAALMLQGRITDWLAAKVGQRGGDARAGREPA
ncbi:MAG: efflux RND transporter permease subunit [Rhodospirillaceae bacterium]|nr:efflux RND transporter permease subunit [Rhodospirillaceae bacterium]